MPPLPPNKPEITLSGNSLSNPTAMINARSQVNDIKSFIHHDTSQNMIKLPKEGGRNSKISKSGGTQQKNPIKNL
eukprot:CAMPEP_0168623664 /NCGR_PEP_ID=MMETSP0449_2-20121227/8952_1 /TAXON_ID=1082188 /ORGANISM="Strombidium rassoulzadegani, Strain ras09" /LENGTH=74 /DNA_ID=CAMNT_0008665073 /DNA_START=208 /DNA_END=428 /DNA_ORIENTATION=+